MSNQCIYSIRFNQFIQLEKFGVKKKKKFKILFIVM